MNEDLATLALAVVNAARAWARADDPAELDDALADAVAALNKALAVPESRQLTWGTVPAGWSVLAPDGQWYRIESTKRSKLAGRQVVTMIGRMFTRDPDGAVTARPASAGDEMDQALENLGWPAILEDSM